MEKSIPSFSPEHILTRSHSKYTLMRYLTLVAASILVLYNAYSWIVPSRHEPRHRHQTLQKHKFRWSDIKPSTSFGFHPCLDDFECARLEVPLDWTASAAEQAERRAAIAVIRLPAKVPPTHPKYGGAILINPGGPGGSGVHMATDRGKALQKVVDMGRDPALEDVDGLFYDIIGFDPRGVNNTTPSPSCFPDDMSRQFWQVAREATGSLAGNATFPLVWSRNKALAESCSKKMSEDWDGIGKYLSTPQVAADMVAIIEALGEWRENEAHKVLKIGRSCGKGTSELLERTKWTKGQEKLLYMGFSYGTLLGATFSTLYPDKVGRVFLDGVVDAEDYYLGTWLSNLVDTDLIIGSFFKQCSEAGPLKCPLWSEDGIEGIRQRYHSLLDKLKQDPLSVDAHGKYSADVITLSDAMNIVRQAVYQPYEWFPKLARYFDLLTKGNGSELAALKQDGRVTSCQSPACSANPYAPECYDHAAETFKAEMSAGILCTDGPADQLRWESGDHYAKWHALREQSRALGDYWAEITMYCANWNVRPAWNFSWVDSAGTGSIKTAFPLLFGSTQRDPVTPLRNAQKMQRKFVGSGLIALEDDGHCSMLKPSLCLARTVSRYFQKGELPMEGLTCMPDWWPFDDENEIETMGEDVRGLAHAMQHLTKLNTPRVLPLGI